MGPELVHMCIQPRAARGGPAPHFMLSACSNARLFFISGRRRHPGAPPHCTATTRARTPRASRAYQLVATTATPANDRKKAPAACCRYGSCRRSPCVLSLASCCGRRDVLRNRWEVSWESGLDDIGRPLAPCPLRILTLPPPSPVHVASLLGSSPLLSAHITSSPLGSARLGSARLGTLSSDYDYYESLNSNKGFRKVITNHCPNHLFTNEIGDNPNQAVMDEKT